MSDTAGATACKRCDNPSSVLFDGCCAVCWSHVEVTRLRAELADLQQVQKKANYYEKRYLARFKMWQESQEELLVAKRNAESWQETAQQAQERLVAAEEKLWPQEGVLFGAGFLPSYIRVVNRMDELLEDAGAAIERAEAAEALVERLRLRVAERRAQHLAEMSSDMACELGWVLTEMSALTPAEAQAQRER